MALIKCTECGRDFSDKASTCPQCAAPLVVEAPLVVTELQSKRIKKHKLIAALMMIVGLVMAFGAGR
jgi:predicted amidophosphoribosyltransferase